MKKGKVMPSEVKRADLVDVMKKIQAHMSRPLPPERYEKWTLEAQYWQRLLNHWPEDEPTRWYGGVEQTLERDLRRIKEESEVND
jgi:hypothetical protein